MSRLDLPHIYELVDCLKDRASPRAYFQDFEAMLPGTAKWKHFVHLDAELGKLDTKAWGTLKAKAIIYLQAKDPRRGWQQAFDCLNEAKAYNYLALLGCTAVTFVPEHKTQTPDLHAQLGTRTVLCEVKTINRSADAIAGGLVNYALLEEFFAKLAGTIDTAASQLNAYPQDGHAKWITYVVVNFDDLLHEHVDDYMNELHERAAYFMLPAIELVLDVKPAFYAATYDSLPHRRFVCSLSGSQQIRWEEIGPAQHY